MAILFTATYPERTVGLILYGTVADYTARDPSNPFLEETDEYIAYIDQEWGTVEHAREEIRTWGAPSHADDERLVQWLASYLRRAASPGAAIALTRMNREINASPALPAIHVPTLVLAKTDDRDFPIKQVREMTDRISGARLVEFSGDEHFFWVGEYGRDARRDRAVRRGSRRRGGPAPTFTRDRALHRYRRVHREGGRARRPSVEGTRGGAPCTRPRTARAVPGRGGRYGGRRFLRHVRRARARGAVRGVDRCRRQPLGVEVRAGVHTGEVELIDGKVGGIAVVIGARVGARAGPSEVLVSQTVKDLAAGSGLTFEDAGEHELKGVPDRWHLYRVVA